MTFLPRSQYEEMEEEEEEGSINEEMNDKIRADIYR